MKTFWCSLVVFLLLIGTITSNFIYVRRTTDEMIHLTQEIPVEPVMAEEALNTLSDYWSKHRDWLGMSVSYVELNRVGELIVSMKSSREQDETADFLRDRALLIPLIEEIRRLEQFGVWNIF